MNTKICTLIGAALLCSPAPAEATPPPPNPSELAVGQAMHDIQPFLGLWQGVERDWPERRVTRRMATDLMTGWPAFYLNVSYGAPGQPVDRDPDPISTLTFDAISGKFRMFVPITTGCELVDVAHPNAATLQWVSHPDGPAIRTTVTLENGRWHETRALLDVDGVVKPEMDVVLERKGAANLGNFATP